MTTSLFIRTYDKDAPWLLYCLRSLDKFATGFSQKVIVTPHKSHDVIHPIAQEFGWEYDVCPYMAQDDYVGQQGTKMFADHWCSGEQICFIDSDLIFHSPFSPECLFDSEGRTLLLKTRYDKIESPWRGITEASVGFPVEWEYMRRFPMSYPSGLLAVARNRIEEVHGKTFENFIRDIPGRHFSEFNVLGAVAEKTMPDKFRFIDTHGQDDLPPAYCIQFWSWGGITADIKSQIEEILA